MDYAYYHKLKSDELQKFVSTFAFDAILKAAKERKPNSFAERIVKVFLNKANTIWVQNVHYYGGENFNEPYCFVAEITHCTTNSAFRRWMNRCPMGNVFTRIPSTY